ncbi:type I polyketide synthase, partial [Pseudoalteromonas holothuriae]|uniref:type I polyketide synthase n=1 Tax=Pseudoalteromonas holothuriae TaxID=2963714 RepID=UPI0021C10FF5
QAGGMQVDEGGLAALERQGLAAMPTELGLDCFYRALNSSQSQLLVLYGDNLKNEKRLHGHQVAVEPQLPTSETAIDIELHEVELYLSEVLSGLIDLPVENIDSQQQLEQYGIDSVMAMAMTNQLEKSFGTLPKTLFFEYFTLRQLAEYFIQSHSTVLQNIIVPNQQDLSNASKVTVSNNSAHVVYEEPITYQVAGRSSNTSGIAIIGLAGIYPQAPNLEAFWHNLAEGLDCVTDIPSERWDLSEFYSQDQQAFGKSYSKWGGFIDGITQFDPLFFNISPAEALSIDPQERLFLKTVYDAIENSGYTKHTLSSEGSVGVFVGVMWLDHQLLESDDPTQVFALPGAASVANRVSYFCNFHGPSMAVDTMCSSSLVSIQLACQSLNNGDIEAAIAGGVNLSMHPKKYVQLSRGRFVSSQGRCQSFGEGGDGYVPGEGVGALVLKPLEAAQYDGDNIYGVIKGIAVNHGGKTNGYSVPNPNAQTKIIEKVYRDTGIDPCTISYIEAHGTGTSLGDPIEIAALQKVFVPLTKRKYAIGSVKSNIGHCEGAAGIAGVTKVLLQMKHETLVPSLHSSVTNKKIDFANSQFEVQQVKTKWHRPTIDHNGQQMEVPLRASVSSFGAGGTNAYLLIEEAPRQTSRYRDESGVSTPLQICILSSRTWVQLQQTAQALSKAILAYDADLLSDILYTLQVGREAMDVRVAIPVTSLQDMSRKLAQYSAGSLPDEQYLSGQVTNRLSRNGATYKKIENALKVADVELLSILWVEGTDVDWQQLYILNTMNQGKPTRIALPGYTYEQQNYPLPALKSDRIDETRVYLHPLVHKNCSTMTMQMYSSTLSAQQPVLADHTILGKRILP